MTTFERYCGRSTPGVRSTCRQACSALMRSAVRLLRETVAAARLLSAVVARSLITMICFFSEKPRSALSESRRRSCNCFACSSRNVRA